jgi:hypothetical protein
MLLLLVLDWEEAAVHGVGRSGGRHQFTGTRTRGRVKWGDWAGAAHGHAERGCIGRMRSPRTVARLATGRVEVDGSNGEEGTWRGWLVQGSCLCTLVLSDVAVRLCNGGHARWPCAKRQVAEASSTEEARRVGVGLAWLSARGCPDGSGRRQSRSELLVPSNGGPSRGEGWGSPRRPKQR